MASSGVVSVLILILAISSISNVEGDLRSNHYANTCGDAEDMIKNTVRDIVIRNREVGANLIRLFFHDCFVEGCDASVMIIKSNNQAEINSIPDQTLASLNVIDSLKEEVERSCEQTVSCADIIAFAAAASLSTLGGPNVDILGGRLDGLISDINSANQQIPAPFFTLAQLNASFASKGLDTSDLVALSGAHTIGKAHCSSFDSRLGGSDPTLNPFYAKFLLSQCPLPNPPTTTVVNNDPRTPTVFDNQYYVDVLEHDGLFQSDAALLTSTETSNLVKIWALDQEAFFSAFKTSFFKMGQLTSGNPGNIRTNCQSFN